MKTKKPNHPYSVIVDWSDEDQTWIGRCPELMLGGVHGNDRDKVYEELCQAVDEQPPRGNAQEGVSSDNRHAGW